MSLFINSIFGGMMIGLGGFAYLSVDNKYIGAFLFSLGLLTIISKGYSLYTGRIYNLKPTFTDIDDKLTMLTGNMIGAYFIIGGLCRFALKMDTGLMWEVKTNKSLVSVFALSILCGIAMYLAVTLYSKEENPLYTIMPIMFFILTGCEHCIANMYYMSLVPTIDANDIMFLLVNIFGNSVGSILWHKLEQLRIQNYRR